MDLDINNYSIDELSNVFKIQLSNINNDNLKNILIEKINTIQESDNQELENNKVTLIKFYTDAYFKLIHFSNENNKLNDINENLKSINENIVNNNILNQNLKKNDTHQSPHYVIKEPTDYTLNVYNKDIRSGIVNPLYRQVIKKYLNINTRFRDNYILTQSNNFSINLPSPLTNVLSIKLVDHDMPFVVHTISSNYNNNAFRIKREGIDNDFIEIKISNGSYTFNCLINEINNKMKSTLDSSNIKIHFIKEKGFMEFYSLDQSNFHLDFFFNNFECINNGTNNKNNTINSQLTLGWILGFRGAYIQNNYKTFTKDLQKTKDISCCYIEDTTTIRKNYKYLEKFDPSDPELINLKGYFYTNTNKYRGEAIFDPHFNNYFLLSVNDFMNNHNTTFITPFKHSTAGNQNIIARIPATTHNSSNFIYPERIYFGPTTINKLEIKLYDEYGRLVELNNSDYSFVLEAQILYEN